MNLEDLKGVVILIGLIALIGAAVAIATDELRTDIQEENAGIACGTNASGGSGSTILYTNCGAAYNISTNGLEGIDNTTGFLDTIGTIAGVAVLIGIVVFAFRFGGR